MGRYLRVGASCDRHGQPSTWLTADKREFLTKIADTARSPRRSPVSGDRFPDEGGKENSLNHLTDGISRAQTFPFLSFVLRFLS